jgi:hypothetical protein
MLYPLLACIALTALFLAATVLYDRLFLLVEYRWKVERCPKCGRSCFARHRRTSIKADWEGWRSACCEAPMD